jgi:hypothetical protein
MSGPDLVSPEVRAIEELVDAEYRSNPLFRMSLADAAWYFLAHCEEIQFKETVIHGDDGVQRTASVVDEIINVAKWPLRWIQRDCQPGHFRPQFTNAAYDAAWKLYDLAQQYLSFESAFTYASMGNIELSLNGNRLVPSPSLRADSRYEAYDRLTKATDTEMHDLILQFITDIDASVRISGAKFKYLLTPAFVQMGMEALDLMFPYSFWLPTGWQFPRYSASDLDRVGRSLQAMAFIHFRAHAVAGGMGCDHLGYRKSLLLMGPEELESRVRRYTGVSMPTVRAILADLTFGAGQTNPDPALQPLIALTPAMIAIAPTLVLGNDLKRNIAVLLNRMPAEKAVYSRVNEERESLSRDHAKAKCEAAGLRTWSGKWPNRPDLPDIDLVVISDQERRCLFLEMKAFLGPADAREVIQRDKEIEKGVSQASHLRTAYQDDQPTIEEVLRTKGYTTKFAVASESGIGSCAVQNSLIPVIRTPHLLSRLRDSDLGTVCEWLEQRAYLPVRGVHYEERDVIARVGNWELEWYGILPLVSGAFS